MTTARAAVARSQMVPNLRDVGGVRTGAGQVVRTGVLLRSAIPYASDSAPDEVAWPPTQVIELRSADEAGPDHPLAAVAPDIVRISLLEALRPDGIQGADPRVRERMRTGGLAALYLGMLDLAHAEISEVVNRIASRPGPTLVHCAAGKDRTGVVVALVLRALDVPREAVVDDYLQTQAAMPDVLRRLQVQAPLDPGHRVPPSYLELPVHAIEAVLDRWDDRDGGAAGWLQGVSGSADVLDLLRDRLLEPTMD
ncbi:MAG: tyrosine-protein phosphatase [Nocardioidaceae bacterium]